MAASGTDGKQHGRRQQGVAAIEFSLALCLLMTVLAGIVGYGALFWAQQRISYAAGEGARAVLHAASLAPVRAADACVVAREAAGWLAVGCRPAVGPCAWDPAGQSDCVSVTVTYDPAGLPLAGILRHLGGADGQGWVPGQLAAQATVQVDTESVQ